MIIQVSIRSPYRSKGRPVSAVAKSHAPAKKQSMFQSAPLTEARGEMNLFQSLPNFLQYPYTCFNPLPLPKQGETINCIKHSRTIHSFNPLPLPKQGETMAFFPFSIPTSSFNPLPLPKQGETVYSDFKENKKTCFNPLPLPKQGETCQMPENQSFKPVSIRSPYRSKGRQPSKFPHIGNV